LPSRQRGKSRVLYAGRMPSHGCAAAARPPTGTARIRRPAWTTTATAERLGTESVTSGQGAYMVPAQQRPEAPADLWSRPDMAEALAARDIGTVIRIFRRWTGASQHEVSMLVGVPQPHISDLERGGRRVTALELFERFADGLAIPRHLLGLAPTSVKGHHVRPSRPGRGNDGMPSLSPPPAIATLPAPRLWLLTTRPSPSAPFAPSGSSDGYGPVWATRSWRIDSRTPTGVTCEGSGQRSPRLGR
jgi:predicted XRE-type DNA-binding protein